MMQSDSFDESVALDGTSSSSSQAKEASCSGCPYASAFTILWEHLVRCHGDCYRQMMGNVPSPCGAPCGPPAQSSGGQTSSAIRQPISSSETEPAEVRPPLRPSERRRAETDRPQPQSNNQHHHQPAGATLTAPEGVQKTHQQAASMEKKTHVCEQCGKGFTELWILKKHKNLHHGAGERAPPPPPPPQIPPTTRSDQLFFSCPGCPYAFTSKVYLWKHLKHVHSGLYWQMQRIEEEEGPISFVDCQGKPLAATSRPETGRSGRQTKKSHQKDS